MTRAFKVSGDTYSIQVYVSNCMGSQVKLVNSCEQEGTKKVLHQAEYVFLFLYTRGKSCL